MSVTGVTNRKGKCKRRLDSVEEGGLERWCGAEMPVGQLSGDVYDISSVGAALTKSHKRGGISNRITVSPVVEAGS